MRKRGEFWGSAQDRLTVLGCEVSRLYATAPEHEVRRHVHQTAHFVFVPGGGYISSATGAPDLSCLPLLVFNPPGTDHRDRFLHGRGVFITLSLGGVLADRFVEAPARSLPRPEFIRIARRLDQILLSGTASYLEIEGLLLSLIASASAAVPAPGSAPSWLSRAYEMIWADTDFSVADVARSVGVHPVHLARVFVDYLGCAPAEALRGRRLERVAQVLGRSRASLADVAAELGFADQSHMSKSFAKNFGMTPARFRRSRDVARVQDAPSLSA